MTHLTSIVNRLVSLLSPLRPSAAGISPDSQSGAAPRPQPPVWFSSDDRDEVEVTRRRAGEGGPRERAQAPGRRQRDDAPPASRGSAGGYPSSGGYGRSTGGGLPIGAILSIFFQLPVPLRIALLAIGACAFGAYLLLGQPAAAPPSDFEPAAPIATFAPASGTTAPLQPTRPAATRAAPPAASPGGSTWLVMLYQDAKDKGLDQDIFTDLNEAERTGSTDRVRIVAQIDRYRGAGNARDWSSARRLYLTRDPDLHVVRSQQLARRLE